MGLPCKVTEPSAPAPLDSALNMVDGLTNPAGVVGGAAAVELTPPPPALAAPTSLTVTVVPESATLLTAGRLRMPTLTSCYRSHCPDQPQLLDHVVPDLDEQRAAVEPGQKRHRVR